MSPRAIGMAGFILLPVILTMSLIAAIAFLLNRDAGMNAAMVSRQGDADRARYAAEAGLQAVNAVVQSKNCGGGYPASGTPLTNGNLGGASYSAYANPTTGNTTSLISTGSYNGTSVTLTRNNVIVYQATPLTYTLQPDAAAGKDTYIASGQQNRNSGIAPTLYFGGPAYEMLLQFDLSIFPAGSRVVQYFASGALQPGALMSLYQTTISGGSGAMSAYLITRSWIEGTGNWTFSGDGATWLTYDGVNAWPAPGVGYDTRALSSAAYTSVGGWNSWDVTDAVQAWLGGAYPNYGVWMSAPSAPTNIQFASSDNTTASRRPKIDFTYLLPCGTTGPSNTSSNPTLAASADTRLDSSNATRNYGASTSIQLGGSSTNRLLFNFDLSGVTPGTLLTNATLRLYAGSVTAPSNSTISLHRVTDPWVEGTKTGSGGADGATWNTRNGSANWTNGAGGSWVSTAAASADISSSFTSGWVEWDVTALAQAWVDGVNPNYGLILRLAPSTVVNINSRENASNPPQLVITY